MVTGLLLVKGEATPRLREGGEQCGSQSELLVAAWLGAPFLASCCPLIMTVGSNPQDLDLQVCDLARTAEIFKSSSSTLVKKEAQKEKAIPGHTPQDGGRAGT